MYSRLPLQLDRRDWLATACGAMLTAALPRQSQAQQAEAQASPNLHVYDNYGWLRGFSLVPSWGARIEEAWWNYDGGRLREEVALTRSVHANCIRLWIEFSAWMAHPDKVTADFLDAVAGIDEAGMKTMPCLFNRWHDQTWDYGGTYTEDLFRDWRPKLEYVCTLVKPLAADPRILCWDLCNEPQAFDLNNDVNRREFEWLKQTQAAVREAGARQPITIGTMYGTNISTYAPLCDVLCGHPYAHDENGLRSLIVSFDVLRKQTGKPLMVNESMPGALDGRRRGALVKTYIELLSTAGMGWMGWAIREGRAISTRRDLIDANGLDGQGFHPFFTAAGQLREGLEVMKEPPQLQPPWKTRASSSPSSRLAAPPKDAVP